MQSGKTRWQHSPAFLLAGAIAAGICWSDRHPDLTPGFGYPLVAAIALLLAERWRPASGFAAPIARLIVACVLLAVAGATRFENRLNDAAAARYLREESSGQEMRLIGRVVTSSRARSGSVRLLLQPAFDVRTDRAAAVILAHVDEDVTPVDGSVVTFRAVLMPWPRARNPGEFDYGRFLRRRGVHGLVRAIDKVQVLREAAGVERWMASLRAHVEVMLDRYVHSAESRSVLLALVLGDRSLIDPALHESFVTTGLVHLLAVSGLHVMIVGLVLFRLAGPLLLRVGIPWSAAEALRVTITLAILGVYALLAGLPTSVVRALVMTAIFLVGPLLRRGTVSLNSLGTACLVILWLQPHSLFEAGFQLSVAAVGGIVLLTPSITEMLNRTQDRLRLPLFPAAVSAVAVSAAATLSTMPVLLAHFGRASLAGIPLNLVGIPLTAVGLLSMVLCIPLGIVPRLAAPLGATADASIRVLIELARAGSEWLPFLAIDRSPGPAAWMLLATAILTVFFMGRPGLQRRILIAGCLVVSAARLLPIVTSHTLEVLFFDVGQGDAALLRSRSGGAILIDAGPRNEHFDAGDRIIVPYMKRKGVRTLDALVLTHAHADHIGGAEAVLRSVAVAQLALADTSHVPPLLAEVLRTADSLRVPVRILSPGDVIRLSQSSRVFALAPSNPVLTSPNENNRSVVLRVEFGYTSIMLMGDAEMLSELDLLERYGSRLASDVVKVGHHGSSTSSMPEFVARVVSSRDDRGWAIVSVGRRNSYGLPSEAVLKRWQQAGMHPLTTAVEGGVVLVSDGDDLRRVYWRSPSTY